MFRLSADEIYTHHCKIESRCRYTGFSVRVDVGFSIDEELQGIGSYPGDAFGGPRSYTLRLP